MLWRWGLWAGFLGFVSGVITQFQCVSLWFPLFQELGWSPWCDNALGSQREGPSSLWIRSPSRGVQGGFCASQAVARGYLDPSANNNTWMLRRSQCHWCIYLPGLLGESRTVNNTRSGGLWAPLLAPGNWGALLLAWTPGKVLWLAG